MHPILENIVIMVLTIVVLLGGAYLVLAILDWGLKIKSGSREQEGLTRLWAAAHKQSSLDTGPSDDKATTADKSSDDTG